MVSKVFISLGCNIFLKKGLKCFIGRGVNYIHNCHGSWISQYQTRATVEIFFTRLRLVKNISTVALVWYCEIHSHDSCVYTIMNSELFQHYYNSRHLLYVLIQLKMLLSNIATDNFSYTIMIIDFCMHYCK